MTVSNICSKLGSMLDVAITRIDGQTVVDLGHRTAPPLPVLPALAGAAPVGLRRGSTVSVSGSISLLLALLGASSAAGAWCALVGLPRISAEAAAEYGIDLSPAGDRPLGRHRPGPAVVHRCRGAARRGRRRRRPATGPDGSRRCPPAGRPGPHQAVDRSSPTSPLPAEQLARLRCADHRPRRALVRRRGRLRPADPAAADRRGRGARSRRPGPDGRTVAAGRRWRGAGTDRPDGRSPTASDSPAGRAAR